MNYYITFSLGIFLFSTALQCSKSTEFAQELLNAIETNNVSNVEQLLNNTKRKALLTKKQKEELVETACASVRSYKRKINNLYSLSVDSSRAKKSVFAGALGLGMLFLAPKFLEYINIFDTEQTIRGQDDFMTEVNLEMAHNDKDPKLAADEIAARRVGNQYSWWKKGLKAVGVSGMLWGLWNAYHAFKKTDVMKARQIKHLIKQEFLKTATP